MKKLLHSKVLLILVAIILCGTFLRAWHFGDWMHYELDQARDYKVIHAAVEYGPGELPLQGPKAAGNVKLDSTGDGNLDDTTTLRLGPLFYYIEYASALIFGDTPEGSVMLIMLLSVATIPVFYFFVRMFFGQGLSLGLAGLFAASLFFVSYSRFGWNPNLMPLFMLLFAVGLLRATHYKRKPAHRGWWLVLAAVSLAFLSNMHFLAFTAAPLIGLLYMLWVRPKIALRFWVGAVAIFFLLNVPLIINDVMTHGENTRAFFSALRGSTNNDHTLLEKVAKNAGEHVRYYWIVVTGDQQAELPVIKGHTIVCDDGCKAGFPRGVVALLSLVAGILAWIWFYKKEHVFVRKNFLRFVALWWCVVFVAYIPLAYDFAPRFFLLNAPLFIVLLGFVVEAGFRRGKRRDYVLGWLVLGLMIFTNLVFVGLYFGQLAQAQHDSTLFRLPQKDWILGERTRVTKGQIEAAVASMAAKYQENNYPLFVHGQSEYKRVLWERIDTRNIPRDHIPKDLATMYKEGNYFIIVRAQSDQEKFLEDVLPALDIQDMKNFGTINVYYLIPKSEALTDERALFGTPHRDPRFSNSAQVRYLWRQVFEGCRYNYDTDMCEK